MSDISVLFTSEVLNIDATSLLMPHFTFQNEPEMERKGKKMNNIMVAQS